MDRAKPRARRCAIYTRKSSEEGLEQDFNSLHAQREACEAFIKSQASEGWKLIKTAYDDGGLSGGTMERPALQRLLADIGEGLVDLVVVYKVDRLTRSLADFAKMVELFDARGVSFVAVTQQFNTTTSMGRLMLNVLLSFAQFEREVTGERIRDKIAASKKKGMWMGRMPPIGYRVNDRKLIIKEDEADVVRHIFRRYAELRSVARLYKELQQQGYRTKLFTSASGWSTGGKHFSRGHLYRILQNRIYLGEVVHQDQSYPGEHAAIIGPDLWNQVEQVFAANRRGEMNRRHSSSGALLKGLIFDDAGNRMSPIHANKRGRRYRYYVSRALLQHRKEAGGSLARIPAHELEKLVSEKTLEALAADSRMKAVVVKRPDSEDQNRYDLLRKVVKRVEVSQELVRIHIDTGILGSSDEPDEESSASWAARNPKIIEVPFHTHRNRSGTQVIPGSQQGNGHGGALNNELIRAVVLGHSWRNELLSGRTNTVAKIAQRAGVRSRYARRILRAAFLAPDIVEAILDGRQPRDLSVLELRQPIADWDQQRRLLGFSPAPA